jgi:hypothetical protein
MLMKITKHNAMLAGATLLLLLLPSAVTSGAATWTVAGFLGWIGLALAHSPPPPKMAPVRIHSQQRRN